MDTHGFASLAQVRILLVPVGGIQKSTFDKLAAEIRTFSEIRLGDIPADIKDERGGHSSTCSADLRPSTMNFQLVSCRARSRPDTSTFPIPLGLHHTLRGP
jgi:hypothetical protein